MSRVAWIAAAALVAVAPAPANAGAGNFTLVNGTGVGMKSVEIRRFGTSGWKSINAPSSPGARSAVSFSDPDCAFDIRANLDGGATATWSGVNLCEAKSVTLSRSAAGAVWVDYD
ncbi:hypothetical protein [Sphingomonas sp.]|uniref:hypothetical protein n=1 Tax=Sphingomonas sp. TaxID=28214 RepID=UPI00286DE1D2|nr:hypothetical protein [Sphingomonas sp.]